MSTSWAFQLSRRHESRPRFRYQAPQKSESAYRWMALIILLSFGAGVFLTDLFFRFL